MHCSVEQSGWNVNPKLPWSDSIIFMSALIARALATSSLSALALATTAPATTAFDGKRLLPSL